LSRYFARIQVASGKWQVASGKWKNVVLRDFYAATNWETDAPRAAKMAVMEDISNNRVEKTHSLATRHSPLATRHLPLATRH